MDNQGIQLDEDIHDRSQTPHNQGPSRQDSAIDLWTTVDKFRLDQDVHIIPLEDVFILIHEQVYRMILYLKFVFSMARTN